MEGDKKPYFFRLFLGKSIHEITFIVAIINRNLHSGKRPKAKSKHAIAKRN